MKVDREGRREGERVGEAERRRERGREEAGVRDLQPRRREFIPTPQGSFSPWGLLGGTLIKYFKNANAKRKKTHQKETKSERGFSQ